MTFIREIIDSLLKEIKAAIKAYVRETENALKKRLQKLLISGIIFSVLLILIISLLGSAALFLIIGQLKYLSTFMPEWQAWDVMGLTAGVIGVLLILALYLFLKKQLKSSPKQAELAQSPEAKEPA
jgi:di/tricarboxylate transporter